MMSVNIGYKGVSHRHSVLFKKFIAHRNDIRTNDFAKRVITEIDGNEILSDRVMLSPLLGTLSLMEISGGAKSLLLVAYGPHGLFQDYYSGDSFGCNCIPFLLELSQRKDFKVSLNHLWKMPSTFTPIFIENEGTWVSNRDAFIESYIKHWTD